MEKRKCPVCGDLFGPKYVRQNINIWSYNYYCSSGCFEDGEKILHDALLLLKEAGVQIPDSVSWVCNEFKEMRNDGNNIEWSKYFRLENPGIKNIPVPSAVVDLEDDEYEIPEESPKEGFMGIIEGLPAKPGPGQRICRSCKNIVGVRTLNCKFCGKDPRGN